VTRTAGEIGAGLAPARASRSIRPGERIHIIGIAGAGASAAALHAHSQGAEVSGCDSGGPSPYTPALEAAGIRPSWTHDASHVVGEHAPERLAVSKAMTAVDPDHAELVAARTAGIPIEPWQQVVADAAHDRRLVAVAGTHGKSTSAGWLTHVLADAGRDPSAFVGALLPPALTGSVPATARVGDGEDFVVEADEYAGNFDPYRPAVVVLTNVDWDHPDVFRDESEVVAAFARWLGHVPDASIIANVGDRGTRRLLDALGDRPGRVVRVAVVAGEQDRPGAGGSLDGPLDRALDGRATIEATDATSTSVSLSLAAGRFEARLMTAGDHNVANALVVAATGAELGLPLDAIRKGLETFPGVGRRLERKGEARGVVVYDDYGHHPTAIRATLAAVRQREPGRRVWVAAEPLTFHRTAAMLRPLAAALAEADGIAVADIWASRDPDRTIATSASLTEATSRLVPSKPVAAPGDVDATADWLADRVTAGDVVLVMGGGRSYRIGERLLERLAAP